MNNDKNRRSICHCNLNIVYGNNHFEPTNECNNVTYVPIISNNDVCNNIIDNIKLYI
jgi:hypothetical protein